MKAEFKAPSPNKRLKRFGMVNPRMKAELQILTPSAAKIKISRNNPVMRDRIVVILTEATFFSSLLTDT